MRRSLRSPVRAAPWPDDLGPSANNPGYLENKPYYNFGCANQANLAAMVDNPSDLVQPRSETPPIRRVASMLTKNTEGHHDGDHLSGIRQGQTQRYRQMISYARQNPKEQSAVTPPSADDHIAPAAARVGASLLRDGGNRRGRTIGRRRPPPRQGPSQDPDGRHGGPRSRPIAPRRRRTSSSWKPRAAAIFLLASISSRRFAIPVPAWS